MDSYSTHNDVTALEFCCRRKNKQKRRKQRARLDTRLGIAERALNDPRNLTSTTLQPQRQLKNNIKNDNKNGEENDDKGRHKNRTRELH
jgi:hypothetical protein